MSVQKSKSPFDVQLNEGWNELIIRVYGGEPSKPGTLNIRVTGDGLRTAAHPDGSVAAEAPVKPSPQVPVAPAPRLVGSR